LFSNEINFTFLTAEAAGEPTTVVVVAVVIDGVFVRPGVITVPDVLSTHEAWISMSPAALVETLMRSDTELSKSMIEIN
jgi:hypothetical protein